MYTIQVAFIMLKRRRVQSSLLVLFAFILPVICFFAAGRFAVVRPMLKTAAPHQIKIHANALEFNLLDNMNQSQYTVSDKKDTVINNFSKIQRTKVCRRTPWTSVVFIKTRKTASSTVASIFQRYGYSKNLLFALPKVGHIFPDSKTFPRNYMMPLPRALAGSGRGFNFLTNHVRYHREGMERIIPNAKYITILRDPVTQLESAFGYFEMAKGMGINKFSNPFETFMENPAFFYHNKDYIMKMRSKNGQLYELGFEPEHFDNPSAVRRKVETLDKEFDLVLLAEYLDESLILMKKLLCWDFNDIVYIPIGVRSQTHRYPITKELRDKIRAWNQDDVFLYDHFNRTFWAKVRNYGADFAKDLQHFRELKTKVMDRCIDKGKIDDRDIREDRLVLNYEGSYLCRNLVRRDEEYTNILRLIMKLGLGGGHAVYITNSPGGKI